MIKPLWKLLNLLMSLGVFFVVVSICLMRGEEMPLTVVRGVLSFVISWIVLIMLGSVLDLVIPNSSEELQDINEEEEEEG